MAKKIIEDKYMSSEEIATLAKATKDVFFFSQFIWVINPVQGKVKFNLYPFQKSVLYWFLKERFNIILKFRQAGITELIAMYCLWLAMYHPNKNINIISIKDTVAKKVLKKIKFMYKNLPWYLQTPLENGRSSDIGTATTLVFTNGSIIESIPTSDQAGRSEALSLLVIDEAAVVRWASTIWASAFPTLSTGGSAIINSCITGDTKIITNKGLLRVKDICPNNFGSIDLSRISELKVLTHKGEWKRIIASVNKGKLETWKIKTEFGTTLKCTPDHKLFTLKGWMSVRDIIKNNEKVILYKTGLSEIKTPPKITIPEKEEWVMVNGYNNYQVSNRGDIKYLKGDKWYTKELRPNKQGYIRVTLHHSGGKTQKYRVADLVLSHFTNKKVGKDQVIDHIDCIPNHNWVTNLQVISRKENAQRANLYSYGLKLGIRVGKGFTDLISTATIKEGLSSGEIKKLGVTNFLKSKEVFNKMTLDSTKSYASKIINGKRGNQVRLSHITKIKEFTANIYDITVEDHHSYITYNFKGKGEEYNFINKNTPYGTGNFYHNLWVESIAGSKPINPIRLDWRMHPERDDEWYETMSRVLGPRRTAQEIDGDFLSSGNTVFDLTDIKAIEYQLSDYPIIRRRLKGQYLEFNEPDDNTSYFIGADCATGRSLDYSSFTCMDSNGEEAVVYKGKMPLNKYARLLGDTGIRYNDALLAPETNDIGIAVTLALQDEGYPNLYHSKKTLKKKGERRSKEELIPGWLTTSKNRSLIIEGLEKDIREDNIIIKDPFFVQESYTFIYDSTGRPIAMGKRKVNSSIDIDLEGETYSDDDIFGKAITNHIRKYGNLNSTVVMPQ